MPDSCDHDCAAVFEPFFGSCREYFVVSLSSALMDSLSVLYTKCGGSSGGSTAVAPAAEQFAVVNAAATEDPSAASMVSVPSQIDFAAAIETIAEGARLQWRGIWPS